MTSPPPWGLEGLDQARFEAYAKLLRLKNGGQVEEPCSIPGDEIYDDLYDVNADETDSIRANTLSSWNNRYLKKAFLDRLAELIANEKGAQHVSASLMVEWPDRVHVLVARNSPLGQNDTMAQALDSLSSHLRIIAQNEPHEPAALRAHRDLWELLIQLYKARIAVYITKTRDAFTKTRTVLAAGRAASSLRDGHNEDLTVSLLQLSDMVNEELTSATNDHLHNVVLRSYDICVSHKQIAFEAALGNTPSTKSLRQALLFLGRLARCLLTFVESAKTLASFDSLDIYTVGPSLNKGRGMKKKPATNAWTAKRTFSDLGLNLDDKTVASFFKTGKKVSLTTHNFVQRFNKLKSPDSQVHAEVQLLLGLSRLDVTGGSVFGYVGCSKLSCFLCYRFIQGYTQFTTRGCHGKLYDLWTVPDLSNLCLEDKTRVARAVKQIETDMAKSIRTGEVKGIDFAAESTVESFSVANIKRQFRDPYTRSLVLRHLDSLHWEVERNERIRCHPEHSESEEPSLHDLMDSSTPEVQLSKHQTSRASGEDWDDNECEICGKQTSRQCSHCNRDRFCSQVCEKKMPFNHLTTCGARPINTADRLFSFACSDEIPDDEETLADFGFTRCNPHQKSHLLGLYKGLASGLVDESITAVRVNHWRVEGTLRQNIIKSFECLPEGKRGRYFPWFLRNQHVLEPSQPRKTTVDLVETAVEEARSYLSKEDREKNPHELQPPAKRYCFPFYAFALQAMNPNPNSTEMDLWYDFGFAACTDEHADRKLGECYARLIGGNKQRVDMDRSLGYKRPSSDPLSKKSPTCSFDEFWQAWATSTLPALFDRYGLGRALDEIPPHSVFDTHSTKQFPGAREFLSLPVKDLDRHPSVWKLKHFLALEPNTPLRDFPGVEEAAWEYGFGPEVSPRIKIGLRESYEKLFRGGINPLEVHSAKQNGELLQLVEREVDTVEEDINTSLGSI